MNYPTRSDLEEELSRELLVKIESEWVFHSRRFLFHLQLPTCSID